MSDSYQIFDRALVRRRKAARRAPDPDTHYLHAEAAEGLREKLLDINRDFEDVLAIGPFLGPDVFRTPPKRIVRAGEALDFDEEALPFAERSFDLVISNLSFHWINDLPGALLQMQKTLKPDGLLLAVMFGAETLSELRMSLLEAEAEVRGGASPRVSPFADVRDAGNLLQRAGFAMPVADTETLTVSYEHPLNLMKDLKRMGEGNALIERRKAFTGRKTMMRACDIYMDTFADQEGRARATFQLLYLTGFAPGPNQPKPLKPGSGTVSLKDALK